jgi:hypothetical protein
MRYLPLAISACILVLPAKAGPATLIIRSGWQAGATGWQISQPSMKDCEIVADYLAKVRTDRKQTVGRTGMWRFNHDAWTDNRLEPNLTMICIPSAEDVPGIAEKLEAEGVFRTLGK